MVGYLSLTVPVPMHGFDDLGVPLAFGELARKQRL
jgi:hypothetical protein